MSDSAEGTYEVGYKKPPKAKRFEKGKSGNPKGRPKEVIKSAALGDALQAIENEEIMFVLDNGKRKRMTIAEANLRELFKRGINGDLKASRCLVAMAVECLRPQPTAPTAPQETELLTKEECELRDRASGKPKKPVGPVSMASLFLNVLNQKIVFGERRMTQWEALVRMIVDQALNGDLSAGRLLAQMRRKLPTKPLPGDKITFILHPEDKGI